MEMILNGTLKEGYSHQKATKEEHEDKVSRASPEGALLQHPAVSIQKNHIEQEIEANWTKKQEVGY